MTEPDPIQQALAHHRAGRLLEAEAIYRRVLARSNDDAGVLNLLGALLHKSGRSAEGHELLLRAATVAPSPGDPRIWNNLGEVARSLGRREDAIDAFRRAVMIQPDYAAAHANLGLALADVARLEEAAASLRTAVALKPDYAKAYTSLGKVLHLLGHHDHALAASRKAVQLNPKSPEFLNNLGNVLRGTHHLDDAIAAYRQALQINPNHAPALHNLGEALAREGDVDAAIDSYRSALAARPDYLLAHQSLLFTMHYSDRLKPEEIFQAHRAWAEMYETPLQSSIAPHTNDRSPDRVLRVGYVSPDFRRHPVGYFLRPVFEHHDPNRVEVFAYNTSPTTDSATSFFRERARGGWRDVYPLSEEQLADQIRADRIDILIDLTLHMAHSRLLTFARKPAPVQATYLGYAHSTGLSAMDYKLTDAFLDPPGTTERFHTERLIRLETNFCCEPEPDAPPVGPLPARRNGHVTFASFNTLMKTNAGVIETWSEILRQLPNSKLMIAAGGLAGETTRQRLRDRFAAHGVTPDRLELLDLAGVTATFDALTRADLALDTFPYAGGTTTANCLWMGVPVVTLAGTSPIARQGLSFLTNVGLPELIAKSRDRYVSIALELARDVDRLEAIRASLRDRMRNSVITDGPRFTRRLEDAYHAMWREWCERGS